jgi:hypothetical protein
MVQLPVLRNQNKTAHLENDAEQYVKVRRWWWIDAEKWTTVDGVGGEFEFLVTVNIFGSDL